MILWLIEADDRRSSGDTVDHFSYLEVEHRRNILYVDGMKRCRVIHFVNHHVSCIRRLLSFLPFECVEINFSHRKVHITSEPIFISNNEVFIVKVFRPQSLKQAKIKKIYLCNYI